MSTRLQHGPCLAKTADFTLDPNAVRCGTVLTNAGATGAVVCTLPQLAANAEWDGYWVEFQGVADQSLAFACTAGKAVCINNAAATSLTASTSSKKIGAVLRARWDASQSLWHLSQLEQASASTVA